jgi:hypothetical protein
MLGLAAASPFTACGSASPSRKFKHAEMLEVVASRSDEEEEQKIEGEGGCRGEGAGRGSKSRRRIRPQRLCSVGRTSSAIFSRRPADVTGEGSEERQMCGHCSEIIFFLSAQRSREAENYFDNCTIKLFPPSLLKFVSAEGVLDTYYFQAVFVADVSSFYNSFDISTCSTLTFE